MSGERVAWQRHEEVFWGCVLPVMGVTLILFVLYAAVTGTIWAFGGM